MNRILPTPIADDAMPPKPKSAATRARTKKAMAQDNIKITVERQCAPAGNRASDVGLGDAVGVADALELFARARLKLLGLRAHVVAQLHAALGSEEQAGGRADDDAERDEAER